MRIPSVKIEFTRDERDEILQRIDRALRAGQIAQGENVAELEARFARYVGARHAVAVSSGGAAIEVAMRLLGARGREVLVPTNTFAATAMAVVLAGGRVRFVDADPATFAVSLAALERAATAATAGVIVVHIGGIITPEIDAIRTWCAARGVWLFEDAAHAHGSALDGRMAGRFGRAAAFSFASTKVLTSGEGGMLVTDEDALAARARRLRDYGKPEPWVSLHAEVGANWRMSEFCAAVGVAHLRGLDERIAAREKVASVYSLALDPATGIQPVLPVGRSSWYKYIVLPPPGVDRARIRQAMAARGVALAGGVYDVPLHRQPVWSGESSAEFPLADDICGRHVCLPIYAGLTEEEARHVVAALTEVIRDQ